jgi:hypothetical protein
MWVRRPPVVGVILGVGVAFGCASVARPPGGPEDKAPPEIVSVSIDTNATNVTAGTIDVTFDEVIAEHPSAPGAGTGAPTLDDVVLVSPQTGTAKVSWHRDRITIEPRGGFKPNTAYRITIMPGIADIRGNVRHSPYSLVFSTGPALPPFSILGRVFAWETSAPATAALVQAVVNPGRKDSTIFLAFTDSAGRFDLGPLDVGKYLVRGFIDADNNRTLGVLEKWDTTTVDVVGHSPVVELRAIQRDTAPVGIQRVEVLDSAWVRVALDKPFDPTTTLSPAFVVLRRADSTEVPIAGVMSEAAAAAARPKVSAPVDTNRVPLPPPPIDALSTRPPVAKPSIPPPERAIVVHLAPGNVFRPDERYTITVRGLPNLVGHVGTATQEFSVPKPAPQKPPPPR